jgi:hypothetical protein
VIEIWVRRVVEKKLVGRPRYFLLLAVIPLFVGWIGCSAHTVSHKLGNERNDASVFVPETVVSTPVVTCIANGCSYGGVRDAASNGGGFGADDIRCQGSSPFNVLRVFPWPGGGAQLILQSLLIDTPIDQKANSFDSVTAHTGSDNLLVEEVLSDDVSIPFSVEKTGVTSGITAIIFVPSSDPQIHQDRLQTALSFVDALPADERIGLWIRDEALHMAADLTVRHAHVKERIRELLPSPSQEANEDTFIALLRRVASAESEAGTISRFIVTVGARADTLSIPHSTVSLLSCYQNGAGWSITGDPVAWTEEIPTQTTANVLADHIRKLREATFSIGVCGVDGDTHLTIRVADRSCTIPLPPPDNYFVQTRCDSKQVARDQYPFGDTVDLIFDEKQLKLFQQYDAEKSEADLDFQVRIGESAPLNAKGHFRGQTSLDCKRKSLNVDLASSTARRLAYRASADEFYLISLCNDEGYFKQVLANRAFLRSGLFPLRFRFVNMRVNGQTRGVYLLLEKPEHTLKRVKTELGAFIRRRFDPEDGPEEVLFPEEPSRAAAALTAYKSLAVVVEENSANSVLESLRRSMDYDLYLDWLSFQSFMRSGDYVDEVFFYGSSELSGQSRSLYFYPMAWDTDDLDEDCHHQSIFALPDRQGILYCAEGDIDKAVLQSEAVYAAFVDRLEVWLDTRLSQSVLANEIEEIRSDLFSILDDEAVCAAMVELQSSGSETLGCAQVRAAIDSKIRLFVDHMETRRTALRSSIKAWQGK